MRTPLYQAKAEFFKTLGHPARIRILELLAEREHAVSELLPQVGVEATSLSQQLAVLRRAGLVSYRKEGSTVIYSLTSPQVADLLTVARRILTEVLTGQVELLADLRRPDGARGTAESAGQDPGKDAEQGPGKGAGKGASQGTGESAGEASAKSHPDTRQR